MPLLEKIVSDTVLDSPEDEGASHASREPLALTADSTGATVTDGTIAGTPLYDAGVDRGDQVISAGGKPIRSEGDWRSLLGAHAPGDEVPLVLRQRGREVRTTLRLGADPSVEVVLLERAGETSSEAQRAFREAWLRSRTAEGSSPAPHTP